MNRLAEDSRLSLLDESGMMGSPSEDFCERIIWLASQFFGMPIILVAFQDNECQWIKSAIGLPKGYMPNQKSFCIETIKGKDVFQVPNALLDPRFAHNDFVINDPHIRFYAGAPILVGNDQAIGTVAVMDVTPRPEFSPAQQRFLTEMAHMLSVEINYQINTQRLAAEIEARKNSELKLSQVGDRFYQSVQGSPVCLLAQDLDLRYTWAANTPAPVTPDVLVGHSDFELFDSSLAQAMSEVKSKVIRDLKVHQCMLTMHLENGERLFHTSFEPVLDADGKATGLAGVAIDVTDYHNAQRALEQAVQVAEAANVARGRYMASVSHDLRQPTQSLTLFLEVAAAATTEPNVKKVLDQAFIALQSLRRLMDEFLDITRLEAGLVVPELQEVDLRPILDELFERYQPMFAAKNLQLRYVPAQATVTTDPALMARLVRNLLQNALRYTESGGAVLGIRRRGSDVLIELTDSGIGIPQEKLSDIFLEFVQLSNSERDNTKGLGLGLSVAKRLAALMGHRIEVDSLLKTGSRFRVRIKPKSP